MTPKLKGYLLGIIAAATYGMNPLFALPLYEAGMNPDSVLLLRYLVAIPILGIMLLWRGRNFRLKRRELPPIISLGLLFSLSSLTLFQSYNYMDAGIASTLLFIYPILVAIIMATLFKERLSKQTILCIIVTLCGIALLYSNDDGSTLSLMGVMLVFASAISYAIYIVGINKTSLRNVATLKISFYVLTFGSLLFLSRLLITHDFQVPSTDEWRLWINILCLAVFPTVLSLVCTTKAIQYIGATPTAILGALEPVTAVVIGVSVFGEVITSRIAIGLLLIIISVTFVISDGNITLHLTRFRKMFPKITRKLRFKK
ncbi:MAG: DMT family transporter [Bacteroidaceae bacterium]|nr:DMT family transporter [Bacteroidaceae bacterium]MBQ7967931.1 DMT family transporter [Bacteroidaceae bacterium]MBR4042239.1 DMT family transporter [Bacteroidaceae bacterium]